MPHAISLLRLPTEILHEISMYLSRAELVACCRVSKLLKAVSMEPLYRGVIADSSRKTILCCETLSTNVSAARKVRHLWIRCYSVNYSWSFFRTLCSALMHVSGVTTLYLSFLDPIPEPYLRGLELCSFPNLRFLFIKMNLTISVLIFICRNSRYIRDLHINCGAPRYRITAPLSTFPELESFSGRCCLIPLFLSGSPVRRISTNFYTSREGGDTVEDMECALKVLHQTCAPFRYISVLSDHWNMHFFENLSRYAPNVQGVQYRKVGMERLGDFSTVSFETISAFTTSISSVLYNFKNITCLDLAYDENTCWDSHYNHFDNDYEVLLSWSTICWSLKLCRLPPQGLQWLRLGCGWVPHWRDTHTRDCVLCLEVHPADLREFPWLESFVKHLCQDHSLNNPFENAQAVGIDYSRASPASLCSEVDEDSDDLVTDEDSSDDDEDSGYSGESSSGNDPGDVGIEIQAFLRRVRISLGLDEQT